MKPTEPEELRPSDDEATGDPLPLPPPPAVVLNLRTATNLLEVVEFARRTGAFNTLPLPSMAELIGAVMDLEAELARLKASGVKPAA